MAGAQLAVQLIDTIPPEVYKLVFSLLPLPQLARYPWSSIWSSNLELLFSPSSPPDTTNSCIPLCVSDYLSYSPLHKLALLPAFGIASSCAPSSTTQALHPGPTVLPLTKFPLRVLQTCHLWNRICSEVIGELYNLHLHFFVRGEDQQNVIESEVGGIGPPLHRFRVPSTGSMWDLLVTCDEKALIVAKGSHLNVFSTEFRDAPPIIIDVARDYVRAISIDHTNPHIVHVGGTNGVLRTYDVNQRKLLRRTMAAHKRPILTIATSYNDEFLISGGADGKICVWAMVTPASDTETDSTNTTPSSSSPSSASSSANSSPSASPSRLPVNNYAPMALLHSLPYLGVVSALAVSHDSARFYAALTDAVVEYDIKTGEKLREFPFIGDHLVDLALTKNDLFLFVAADDLGIRQIDTRSGAVVHMFEISGVQTRIALSPNEKTLIVGAVDLKPNSTSSANCFFRVDTGERFKTTNATGICPVTFCNR